MVINQGLNQREFSFFIAGVFWDFTWDAVVCWGVPVYELLLIGLVPGSEGFLKVEVGDSFWVALVKVDILWLKWWETTH